MAHSYEELKTMTVAQLREIAATSNHEAVKGYTQLNKEHLLVALCTAFGIDMHKHHTVKGINKSEVKLQIRALKKKRDAALHDSAQLKLIRREMHALKRKLHSAAE
jgi:hypothetical protein